MIGEFYQRLNKKTNHPFRPSSPPTPLLPQETVEKYVYFTQTLSSSLFSSRPSSPADVPIVSPSASIYAVTASEQISIFSIPTFEGRLQQHFNDTFHVKILIERNTIPDKTKGEKSRIIIKITGQEKDVENAMEDLINLFSTLRTRTFDDKTGRKIISNTPSKPDLFFF
jgi:hypothetical protein